MPLSRVLLLHLCGLLLAVFAVTAAHAAAPPYGSELEILIESANTTKTRTEQANLCKTNGGVLLPMVTNDVYLKTLQLMNSKGITYAIGYMGGSTMLSSSECKAGERSLSCIWYWDQGRYAGAENATAFYKGNRETYYLPGAGMVSTLVGNYWGDLSSALKFPGTSAQRYGMALRRGGALGWADSSDTTWSYTNYFGAPAYFVFCASETSTSSSTTSTTSSSNSDAPKSTGLSTGAIVGIVVGAAALVALVVVFILCLACCCGWCCFAAAPAVAPTASQGGGMSRTNSCRSCRSGFGDAGNRSFHDGTASKDGYSRRSSFHGGVEDASAEAWQGGDHEMVSVSGSHYGRTASGANGSWAPPPRAPSQMMMPVPPHMMVQPQRPMSMHGNWLA